MNRPSIILTLSLLLLVLLINLNATLASQSVASLRQSPSIRILNVVNSTNSTAEDDATNSTSNETSNNNTNTNTTTASETPTAAPTNAAAPAMAPFTHEPTKKYEPQDDEEEEEEENNKTAKKAGIAVLVLLGLGLGCYFRDAIVFFVGSVCINTNRYGCKGCIQTCFPCIFGSSYSSRPGGDNLDQIIFETTEDDGLGRRLVNS